jgi:signal recognition particle receptor subunit beta
MSRIYKIAFIGEPGSGKTTCISALSQITPLDTEVACTDELAQRKATTTVALDYGELDLDDGEHLHLYGLPGQARFRFMFDVVREGLVGVVVLVDASSLTGIDGLAETLEVYAEELRCVPCVVALNKCAGHPPAGFAEAVQMKLLEHQLPAPILAVDVRRRRDMVRITELLFTLIDYVPSLSVPDAFA